MGTTNKGEWYKTLISKIDDALKREYYFEAIFIAYMIIDDRIKTLSELAGLALVWSNGKPKMLGNLLGELEALNLTSGRWGLLNNSLMEVGKDNDIQAFITARNNNDIDTVLSYEKAPRLLINYECDNGSVKSAYENLVASGSNNVIKVLRNWINKRNHWMHAAGDDNLTVAQLNDTVAPLAVDGASLSRELCDITTKIRRSTK